MENIVLIGGGGHCASCIDIIEQEAKFQIAGIIDIPDKLGTTLLGYPVIGSDENLALLKESVEKRLREVFPCMKDSHHAELNSLTST